MIRVNIKKDIEKNRILHVTVTGHANYDKSGKDIVCSAVSALTIGAVNSVELLLNIDLKPEQDEKKGGYIAWDVPVAEHSHTDDQLQLLMKALVESLLMIEKEYKPYLQVSIETSQ